MAISAADLHGLLGTDEALGLRFVVHREHDYLAVTAGSLTALVRRRLDKQASEADVERAVRALGGRREQPISLDNLVLRAINRLRGRANPPAPALYLVPKSVFPDHAPAPAIAHGNLPPPR